VALDDKGTPLVGARLYTFANKSTTPKATYRDASGSAANTNPVILDANGSAVLYLTGNELYTFVLKDQFDVLLWTQDDILGQLDLSDLDAAVGEATRKSTEAAQQAALDANRAEAAADAATLASGLYPDTNTIINGGDGFPPVAEGRFATTPSHYSTGFLDLYRVQSGVAVYIDTYPNREAIHAVIRLASTPGPTDGDFHPLKPENRTPIIIDGVGKTILAVDELGIPVRGWAADFHRPGLSASTCYIDESGKTVMAVDSDGMLIQGWMSDFHSGSSLPVLSYTDEKGVVIMGWDAAGNMIIGGGLDPSSLQSNVDGLAPGTAWNDHGRVSVLAKEDSFYRRDVVPYLSHYSVLYEQFDALVAQFPDYITRTLLSQDALGNPIYQYEFIPPNYHLRWYDTHHQDLISKPKIILLGGTHGNEKWAAATNFTLMREIAVNWRNHPLNAKLRWGCHFVVVPIVTPTGFNANSHLNHNGVNINRNYPFRWETAMGDKGPSPASEAETQAVLGLAASHADACGFVDAHNAGGLISTGYAYWLATERGETLQVALDSLNHMVEYDKREYATVPADNSPIVQLTDSYDGSCAKHMQHILGFNAFTAETGAGFGPLPYQRERHALEGIRILIWNLVQQENLRRQREYDFTWTP